MGRVMRMTRSSCGSAQVHSRALLMSLEQGRDKGGERLSTGDGTRFSRVLPDRVDAEP